MNGVVARPTPSIRESSRDQDTRAWTSSVRLLWSALVVSLLATFAIGPANATVSLRVEARPVNDPIQAFVTVTDADGKPVSGLAASDFTLLVDGVAVSSPGFTRPPVEDPNQKVSVVFVMDYSDSVVASSLVPMQESVIAFIDSMKIGDYAAIVKFNARNPEKVSVEQPFTQIDGGAGTVALKSAVMAPFPGSGTNATNLYDAVKLAAEQFPAAQPPLPTGPKAIIVISDGGENASSISLNTVVASANQAGVPVFTIGVGTVTGTQLTIMNRLADETGGDYLPAPSDAEIGNAYVSISNLLNGSYVLTFASSITDCNPHTIEVRVTGQAATTTFTRCTAASTPPPPSGGGGGGGGGSTGLLEFIAGVSLLALRRRRRRA